MSLRFVESFNEMAVNMHTIARQHGFWATGVERNKGELIALMHSELSELLEAERKYTASQPCVKVPEINQAEEELADLVIRAMDYAAGHNLDLGRAIALKASYNMGRPYMHGKKF